MRNSQVTPIVDDFHFSKEVSLLEEQKNFQQKITNLQDKIEHYNIMKSILYLRDEQLEIKLPLWLNNNLGLNVSHVEGNIEDFMMFDDGKAIAIGEVKGISKNIRREHV